MFELYCSRKGIISETGKYKLQLVSESRNYVIYVSLFYFVFQTKYLVNLRKEKILY